MYRCVSYLFCISGLLIFNSVAFTKDSTTDDYLLRPSDYLFRPEIHLSEYEYNERFLTGNKNKFAVTNNNKNKTYQEHVEYLESKFFNGDLINVFFKLDNEGANGNARFLTQKGWFAINRFFTWEDSNDINCFNSIYYFDLGGPIFKKSYEMAVRYRFISYENRVMLPSPEEAGLFYMISLFGPSLSPSYIIHSPGMEINFDWVRLHINGYFSQQTAKTARDITPKTAAIRFLEQSRVGWDAQLGFNIKGFFPFFQFNQYWLEGNNFTAITSDLTPSKATKKINGWVVGMNYQLPWFKHMSIGVQRVHDNIYQGRWKINWQFNLAHEDSLPLRTPASLVRHVKWLSLSNDTIPAVLCL